MNLFCSLYLYCREAIWESCHYYFSDPLGGEAVTFSQVVLEVMRHLEGAYALIFKSRHYPNELIACKRGSPLLLGVKVNFLLNWMAMLLVFCWVKYNIHALNLRFDVFPLFYVWYASKRVVWWHFSVYYENIGILVMDARKVMFIIVPLTALPIKLQVLFFSLFLVRFIESWFHFIILLVFHFQMLN